MLWIKRGKKQMMSFSFVVHTQKYTSCGRERGGEGTKNAPPLLRDPRRLRRRQPEYPDTDTRSFCLVIDVFLIIVFCV